MANNEPTRRELAAERHWSMSRRRFLRGVGACVALPALPSLLPRVSRAAEAAAGSAAATAAGAPRADGVCHDSERREPGALVAEGRRQEF